ncbi:hypothetical protein AKJ16_DCAP23207 [Drosera capensis]
MAGPNPSEGSSKKRMSDQSNMIEFVDEVNAANVTMCKKRAKAKDVLTFIESRLGRMEEIMKKMVVRLKDDILSNETIDVREDTFKCELQGVLNSLMDKLRKKFQVQVDEVRTVLTSLQEELKVIRVDVSLCNAAIANGGASNVGKGSRIDAPKPKVFSGKRDAKELDIFLFNMDQYFDHMGIENKETKVKMATLFLSDTTTMWWRRHYNDI